MLTVRHIEKLWDGRKYQQILNELIGPRVEVAAADELKDAPAAAGAALALIRLDELHQAHAAICPKLIRTLVATQESDGGWGEVAVTALCLNALSLQQGRGLAIEAGMAYLAALQQPTGIWPKIPIRRMPEDALVSAFVLLQLADSEQFQMTVDFAAAVGWFEAHAGMIDPAAKVLWDHARLRVPANITTRAGAEPSWS